MTGDPTRWHFLPGAAKWRREEEDLTLEVEKIDDGEWGWSVYLASFSLADDGSDSLIERLDALDDGIESRFCDAQDAADFSAEWWTANTDGVNKRPPVIVKSRYDERRAWAACIGRDVKVASPAGDRYGRLVAVTVNELILISGRGSSRPTNYTYPVDAVKSVEPITTTT